MWIITEQQPKTADIGQRMAQQLIASNAEVRCCNINILPCLALKQIVQYVAKLVTDVVNHIGYTPKTQYGLMTRLLSSIATKSLTFCVYKGRCNR